MSFLGGLFGFGKTREEKEVEAIFKQLSDLINSDQKQNLLQCESLRKLMEEGGDVDENPGASGEFGRSLENPIPSNGPIGEVIYLSTLLTENGEKVFFHRLGSKDRIDIYELVSQSGSFWDILYVDMYHTRKTRRAPLGYKFQPFPVLLRGTNSYYPNFPHKFYPVLSDYLSSMIGMSIADSDAKFISDLKRPQSQQTNLLFYEKIIKGRLSV